MPHLWPGRGDAPPEFAANGERTSRITGPSDFRLWSIGVEQDPRWIWLNRNTTGAPSAGPDRTWYNALQPCSDRTGVTGFTVCDEYPFFSTSQGGPLGQPHGGPSSLKFVPGIQDLDPEVGQGGDLNSFYSGSGCDIGDGDPFLVIPIVDVRPAYNAAATLTGNPTIDPGFALPDSLANSLRSDRYCAES